MKKIFLIVIVIALIGGGFYFFRDKLSSLNEDKVVYPENSGATEEAIAEISEYEYTEVFTNAFYGFSFRHPFSFVITRFPDGGGGEAILVQNIAKNVGAQILVTPFDDIDTDLTEADIRESIPDLDIQDAQEVIIGENRKGLAFLSDNDQFGGQSREVWFVFRGNLYQISTYVELDEFLKGLFATWEFN